MNKKKLLFLLLLLITAIGILCFLHIRHNTYGDSYPEQQRKSWNDILAAREPWLLTDCYIVDRNQKWGSGGGTGRSAKDKPMLQYWSYENQTNTEIISLLNILSNRCDREALSCPFIPPDNPDTKALPLEGLTEYELLEKGEQGDAESYMELTSRFLTFTPFMNSTGKPQEWLEKAAHLNRPGAAFLANVYKQSLLIPQKNPPTCVKNAPISPVPSYIANSYGFNDFLKLIGQGDYRLFCILSQIDPDIQESELAKDMQRALETRTRSGDTAARRQLGDFYWKYPVHELTKKISVERTDLRFPKLKWLPQWVPFVHEQETSNTLQNCLKGEKLLKQAAADGDLTAKHLWIIKAFSVQQKLTAQEWINLFQYSDDLIKAGYAPFLEELILPQKYHLYRDDALFYFHWGLNVLASYYTRGSMDTLISSLEKQMKQRGAYSFLPESTYFFSLKSGKEKTRVFRIVEALNPAKLYYLFIGKTLNKEPEIKEKLIASMHALAEKDDILALFFLAQLYESGNGVPQDTGRASSLMSRCIDLSQTPYTGKGGYRPARVIVLGPDQALDEYVRIKFILLNLLENFPDRDLDKVRSTIEEIRRALETKNNPVKSVLFSQYLPFCQGLAEELGLNGTPRMDKAVAFYKQGKTDYDMYRLAYLYSHGMGVDKDENLAKKYRNQAQILSKQFFMPGSERADQALSPISPSPGSP